MSLDRIFSRYNGDFDIIPDGPAVTWAEFELANYVVKLEKRIGILEGRLASLEGPKVEAPANPGLQSDAAQAEPFFEDLLPEERAAHLRWLESRRTAKA